MPNMVASDLEAKVHGWLTKRGILFEFQAQAIGGFSRELGDAIVDFLLTESNIALRVQGAYWHTHMEEKARDSIQKIRLQSLGFVVIDVWEGNIQNNLDYTMQQALRGIEVTPQGQENTSSEFRVASRPGGIIPIPGRVMGPKTLTGTLISVQTDEASGLAGGQATLNGKLLNDGGMYCKCRFRWDTATVNISAKKLCILFPWRFYRLIRKYSSNISLNFAPPTISSNYANLTDWQLQKSAGDTFSQVISVSPGQDYAFKAEAENDYASDLGDAKEFTGV